MGATTSRGYRFPLDGDQFDPTLDLANLAADIDADVTLLAAGSASFLGAANKTSSASGSVSGTTFVTIHSITVAVPQGLGAGKRIKVTGFAHMISPSGVGARIQIQGGDARSSLGGNNGDLNAFPRFDASTAAGNRTYNLQVAKTVSGGDPVDWRYPHLSVEVV